MSAAELREAAELMRERAVSASAPEHPWVVDIEGDAVDVRARRGAGPTVVQTIPLGYRERRANAAHIASWHPLVALAVADWLEAEVPNAEFREKQRDHSNEFRLRAEPFIAYYDPTTVQAINVARTYLGGVR